eukprot:TRINITY_DN6742_c0_g1_i2.p1 TRINITY_DN6742_c0_g1~~TRINITY_DN6742_c0_g1_i2.p1  ORF type:complete len:201 (+),score=55.54 TRINITY_DN6742_c0_g1_i2:90-692(+)
MGIIIKSGSMREILLELSSSDGSTKKWELECGKEYSIGRLKSAADIVIEHISISRKHAKVTVSKKGSLSIEDLNSANGTYVDGKKIGVNQIVILRPGAQIILGECNDSITIGEREVETPEQSEEEDEEATKVSSKATKKANDDETAVPNGKKKKAEKRSSPSRSRSRSQERKKGNQTDSKPDPAAEKKKSLWVRATLYFF